MNIFNQFCKYSPDSEEFWGRFRDFRGFSGFLATSLNIFIKFFKNSRDFLGLFGIFGNNLNISIEFCKDSPDSQGFFGIFAIFWE